jgi:hypothetical protein
MRTEDTMTETTPRTRELASKTNDELDAALVLAMDARNDDGELLEELLSERSRRIAARQAELAASGEVELDEPAVRVRRLTDLQTYRLETEAAFVDGAGELLVGRTYVEGSRELLEALRDRVAGFDVSDLVAEDRVETDAQAAMARRGAIVSRETLAAKLAAALGYRRGSERHRAEARRVSKLSAFAVLEEN